MTHSLSYQQAQRKSGDSEKGHSSSDIEWPTRYQTNRTRVGVRTVRWRDTAKHGIESLTSYQTNRTKDGVTIVRRDIAAPSLESLTSYQANGIQVGMRIVRKDMAGAGMKSLTNYKVKKKVGVRRYGFHWLDMTWNYSQPVKPTKQWEWGEWEDIIVLGWNYSQTVKPLNGASHKSEKRDSWTFLEWNHSLPIKPTRWEWEWRQWEGPWLNWAWNTYKLSNQQDQGGNEDNENGHCWNQWNHSLSVKPSHWIMQPKWKDSKKRHMVALIWWNHSLAIKPTGPEWECRQWYGIWLLNLIWNHSQTVKPAKPDSNEWEQWEGTHLGLAWNHPQPIKPIEPEREWENTVKPDMELPTSCQTNETKVEARMVRGNIAECIIKWLTACQTNGVRVRVKAVRRDTVEPSSMKSLTRCQANRARGAVMTLKKDTWIWYRITHPLSNQQDQIESEDNVKSQTWYGTHLL